MIKSNQGDISISLLDFNKATHNDKNTGVVNNSIPNYVNTVVGISTHYEIPLSFELEVYDEA